MRKLSRIKECEHEVPFQQTEIGRIHAKIVTIMAFQSVGIKKTLAPAVTLNPLLAKLKKMDKLNNTDSNPSS